MFQPQFLIHLFPFKAQEVENKQYILMCSAKSWLAEL